LPTILQQNLVTIAILHIGYVTDFRYGEGLSSIPPLCRHRLRQ
jgi:hypothetical protein